MAKDESINYGTDMRAQYEDKENNLYAECSYSINGGFVQTNMDIDRYLYKFVLYNIYMYKKAFFFVHDGRSSWTKIHDF